MGDEYSSQRCKGKAVTTNNPVSRPDEYMQCDSGDIDTSELNCSQGSNHSLNSSWSSISSKSQEIGPLSQADDLNINGSVWLGEGSQTCRMSDGQQSSSSSTSGGSTIVDMNCECQKLVMTRMSPTGSTSPVAVPCRTSLRQRNESSSSLSVGSWQYVSSTGSLRSTASGSTISSSNSRGSNAEGGADSTAALPPTQENTDTCFVKRKRPDHSQCGSSCAVRRERLDQIRKLFLNCYCQSIGHNLKDGSEASAISNILGNIAGKIISGQKS